MHMHNDVLKHLVLDVFLSKRILQYQEKDPLSNAQGYAN